MAGVKPLVTSIVRCMWATASRREMELVRAQIDHRSLFLLKAQWQQSWDVSLHYRDLRQTQETVDHGGQHHRYRGMCFATHSLRGCPSWCGPARRGPAPFNFCAHLTKRCPRSNGLVAPPEFPWPIRRLVRADLSILSLSKWTHPPRCAKT